MRQVSDVRKLSRVGMRAARFAQWRQFRAARDMHPYSSTFSMPTRLDTQISTCCASRERTTWLGRDEEMWSDASCSGNLFCRPSPLRTVPSASSFSARIPAHSMCDGSALTAIASSKLSPSTTSRNRFGLVPTSVNESRPGSVGCHFMMTGPGGTLRQAERSLRSLGSGARA